MSMNDPIADLLTRIRNAHIAKHDRLDVPLSKQKIEVLHILKQEGFIRNFKALDTKPVGTIRILLRYTREGLPAIQHISRISKPGRRVYRGAEGIRPVRNGLGVGILSTSRGLMTDSQARDARLGGEYVCQIW